MDRSPKREVVPSDVKGVKNCRPPANFSKRRLYEYLIRQGYVITHRGYPSFICYRNDGDFALVTVEGHGNQHIKRDTARFLWEIARRSNIKSYRYDADKGLVKLDKYMLRREFER